MAEKEEFKKAWTSRQFKQPPPVLDCLEADASGNLDMGALSRSYADCQDKLKEYQELLDQHNFISTFLWDLAHSNKPTLGGIKPSNSFGQSIKIKGVPSETDLDTLVLAEDDANGKADNLFYSYATLPECNDRKTENDRKASSATSDAIKRDSQTGPMYYEVESGRACPEQNSNSTGLLKLQGPGRERLKTLEPPPTKEKPKFSTSSFKKTGSLKSNSFDSGNALTRQGSDCHTGVPGDRASTASIGKLRPVPAPRPSVKGPSSSRGSTISETNVAVVAPYKSEPVSEQTDNKPVIPQRQTSMEPPSGELATARGKYLKGPLPVPNSGRVRRQHAYEEIHLDGPENGGKVHIQTAPKENTDTTNHTSTTAAAPLATFKPVRVAPPAPASSASEPASPAFSTFGKSSVAATPSPQVKDNAPPSLAGTGATGGEAIYAVPHDVSNKANDDYKNVEYSEALHVERIESVDDDSSSDEEPVYYNLLLMKQNTMTRASIDTMGNTEGQRRNVEQKARRLSQRFSKSIDPSMLSSAGMKSGRLDSVGEDTKQSRDGSASLKEPPITENVSTEEEHVWKRRHSMAMATDKGDSTSISSTCSDDNELDISVPYHGSSTPQVRKFVVHGILESEKNYVDILDILLQYMQTFKNVVNTPQIVISEDDIKVIFFKIFDLHQIHYKFIHAMEPIMESWTEEQSIAEPFKLLALEECQIASEYLRNYHKAVSAVERCTQEKPQFEALTKEITCKGFTDKPSLQELLHKPVVRFQRNTLMLHDLIKCTPTTHKDYDLLQKTLKITTNFLESFQSPKEKTTHESQRYLSKQGLLVEEVGTSKPQRKLRHVFLFNDVLICAKQKLRPQRITYEVKWHIPLIDLVLEDKKCRIDEKKSSEVEDLQHRVSELQAELKSEMRKARSAQEGQVGVINSFQRSWSFRGHARNLEKVKKKLLETEAQLLLWSPHIGFKLKSKRHPKGFNLLMASDYERMAWQETITGLKTKVQPTNFAGVDWNQLINSQKQPKVPSLNAMLEKEDFGLSEEDCLSGSLTVTIHKLNGLTTPCDTYCCVEVDSFGHFFLKAKTNTMCRNSEPTWDEAFEIDLEGSQTLRLLCYKEPSEEEAPVLLGKCALELSKAWLRGDFKESPVSLNNEMSITLSLRYSSREQTLKRAPSAITGGLFGVKLNKVTQRENSNIPIIVTTCVQEIERRGIKDVGIYRISGLSAEIQKMKKAFEKSSRGAAEHAKRTDVNVLTGLLKLYFRELPEALFTDKLYPSLVDVMGMADPENKEKLMLNLVRSLPEPNHSTVVYMLEHLVLISQHELHNKMSLNNLATVFGPTLLRPAIKQDEPQSMEAMFSAGARDAMMQTGILLFLLNLKVKGSDFGTKL